MRELLKRLDRLEAATLAHNDTGHLFIISWVPPENDNGPMRAECGGVFVSRDQGEDEDSFVKRASDHFRPATGARLMFLHHK